MKVCGQCGRAENFQADSKSELRPYGPGGSLICYRCAFATPEAEARTEAAFGALLEGAAAISPTGLVAIGDGCEDGPRPFDPQEAAE